MIGTGFSANEHLRPFSQREDVEVTAIADPQQRSDNEVLQVLNKIQPSSTSFINRK